MAYKSSLRPHGNQVSKTRFPNPYKYQRKAQNISKKNPEKEGGKKKPETKREELDQRKERKNLEKAHLTRLRNSSPH